LANAAEIHAADASGRVLWASAAVPVVAREMPSRASPDLAQQPDAWRRRITIVFDRSVSQSEQSRRFLIAQIQSQGDAR